MLKVLKELTGKGQTFQSFGDEADIFRHRRSTLVWSIYCHLFSLPRTWISTAFFTWCNSTYRFLLICETIFKGNSDDPVILLVHIKKRFCPLRRYVSLHYCCNSCSTDWLFPTNSLRYFYPPCFQVCMFCHKKLPSQWYITTMGGHWDEHLCQFWQP